MTIRPLGVRPLATAAACATITARILLEALLLLLALALLLAGIEPQPQAAFITYPSTVDRQPAAIAPPPLEQLPVVALRSLARQQLGSTARPGGRRIAQATKGAIIAALAG